MGTGWSQDEASQSQPGAEPGHSQLQDSLEKKTGGISDDAKFKTVEKAGDVKLQAKVEESTADAKPSVIKPKAVQEVTPPHMWETILQDADSPVDRSSNEKIYDQLYHGVFLNQKRKKYWVERRFNRNCFFLLAKDLSITWAEDSRFWLWTCLQETSYASVDVAELLNVCWLEVHGKFDTKLLSPGLQYEVVFVIMLKDPAYGWDVPVNFRLILPSGIKQEHKENLMIKPRGQWIEIPVGEFKASAENAGEMEISLYEYEGGKWKRGLVIKGVAIRPKS